MAVFGVPTFCLITGASRGLGRGIAVEMVEHLGEKSVVVLTARGEAGLKETKALMEKRRGKGVDIRVVPCDLSKISPLKEKMCIMYGSDDMSKFKHVILVNCAASVGDITKLIAQHGNNPPDMQDYFDFNITAVICLLAKFLEVCPKRAGQRRSVINISSGAEHDPFPFMSLYCASKAAKNILFRVLANEDPDLKILNYFPGRIDTDMHTYLRESIGDPNIRAVLKQWHDNKELITPFESAKMLMKIFKEDKYESGGAMKYEDHC